MEASTLTHAQRRAGLLTGRSPLLKVQKDEKLIGLVRSGNQSAFEALFDRYQARLLAFCRHMLRSNEDAEDVLQEVFVAAYNAILQDDRRINARPWLYRIARNRCLNHLRRPVPEGQDTMDFLQSDGGTSTADRVQRREEFRRIISDVQSLPETQRTALLLRELDALSYEDIAHAMDTTVPSVKSLLVRARIALAESSQARQMTCAEVQIELAEAAEQLTKLTAPGRRHVRECERCAEFRKELRHNDRALALAFLPVAPLLILKNSILGKLGIGAAGAAGATGAASAGGGAGIVSGAAASGGGLSALGSVICSKTAAGMATAALLTAGAVEVKRHSGPHVPAPAPQAAAAEPAKAAAVKPPPAPVPALAPSGEREAQPAAKSGSSAEEEASEARRAEQRERALEQAREEHEEEKAERRRKAEREQDAESTEEGSGETRITDRLIPVTTGPGGNRTAKTGSSSDQSTGEQTGETGTSTQESSTDSDRAGARAGTSGGTVAPPPE